MMRRLVLLGDRLAPSVLCGYFTAAAIAMFSQWRSEQSVAFYPWLWPWLFALAAILLFAYALRPNHTLGACAGAAMVAAVLSRGMTLLFTWADGSLPFSRAFLGAITWGVLGWAIAYIWIRLLELRG